MAPLNLALMLAWSAAIGVCDLRTRRIPNLLNLGAVAVAILVLLAEGKSVVGGTIASAALAAGLAAALTLPAYVGGMLGAGDVKLAVAMGMLSDLKFFGMTFAVAGLLSGVWAVLWLLWRRYGAWLPIGSPERVELRRAVPPGAAPSVSPSVSRKPVPFGAALGVGFILSLSMREFFSAI
ncbi:MAG: prepilin peptidase [Gammaproteobacteria bacterium]|nr:prepilin peptidase [Gammaproteobacteria bacterium]